MSPVKDGKTALHIAASLGNIELATLLVEEGADIDSRDNLGATPIHYAVRAARHEMVCWLISCGASVSAGCNSGDTPLHDAAVFGDIRVCKTLIDAGADIAAVNAMMQTPYQASFSRRKWAVCDLIRGNKAFRKAAISAVLPHFSRRKGAAHFISALFASKSYRSLLGGDRSTGVDSN